MEPILLQSLLESPCFMRLSMKYVSKVPVGNVVQVVSSKELPSGRSCYWMFSCPAPTTDHLPVARLFLFKIIYKMRKLVYVKSELLLFQF